MACSFVIYTEKVRVTNSQTKGALDEITFFKLCARSDATGVVDTMVGGIPEAVVEV